MGAPNTSPQALAWKSGTMAMIDVAPAQAEGVGHRHCEGVQKVGAVRVQHPLQAVARRQWQGQSACTQSDPWAGHGMGLRIGSLSSCCPWVARMQARYMKPDLSHKSRDLKGVPILWVGIRQESSRRCKTLLSAVRQLICLETVARSSKVPEERPAEHLWPSSGAAGVAEAAGIVLIHPHPLEAAQIGPLRFDHLFIAQAAVQAGLLLQ